MALDPRISLGVQPVQLSNPLDQYGKIAALQQAQNQNALAQYQLGAAQRADEQAQNRLRLFQEAGGDPGKVANAFLQSGDWKGYTELTRNQSEKRAADLKFNADLAQRAASIYSTVKDEPTWQMARQKLAALGGDASTLPATYDPAFVQSEIQQAFSIKDLAERVLTSQSLGGTNRVISTPKYALPGTTPTASVVPGSVGQVTMTPDAAAADARARQRLAFEIGQASPAAVEAKAAAQERGRASVDGGKPLTESQAKAANFAGRMNTAFGVIDKLEGSDPTALAKLAAGSSWTNILAPEAAQQYRQAQENWVTANLRKESGAVIGPDEMANEIRKYFPIAGDKPKNIEQKRQARLDAMAGMEAEATEGGIKAVQKSRQALGARYQRKPAGDGVDTSNPLLK